MITHDCLNVINKNFTVILISLLYLANFLSNKTANIIFLVADTQLYKRLCPSVGWSVGRAVRRGDRVEKWENTHFRPCPPIRNWWPCIRPCFLVFFFFFKTLREAIMFFRVTGLLVTPLNAHLV